MALDLNTNGKQLSDVVNQVLNGKLCWCVFGYTGQSNTLKLVETGNDELEEMFEEFIGSAVMYGYARVKDPNTDLPKYVFINWQGSAAPERLKFSCSQHLQAVQKFCRTIHITINARSEDDLDITDIINKVAKASGANYSIHKEKPKYVPLPTQVGSVYQKTNAQAEISTESRDAYWNRMEQEEKQRKEAEMRKKQEEADKREAARKERERKENEQREKLYAQRSAAIADQKNFEKSREIPTKPTNTMQDSGDDENERRLRSQQMKEERQNEMKSMLNARKNSTDQADAVGTTYNKWDPQAEIKAARNQQSFVSASENVGTNYKKVDPMEEIRKARMSSDTPQQERVGTNYSKIDPMAEIKSLRQTGDSASCPTQSVGSNYQKVDPAAEISKARTSSQYEDEEIQDNRRLSSSAAAQEEMAALARARREAEEREMEEERRRIQAEREAQIERERQESEALRQQKLADQLQSESCPQDVSTEENGPTAVALYDYQASEEDELTFDPGDVITAIEMIDEGWWVGTNPRGERGLFPANYVELQN